MSNPSFYTWLMGQSKRVDRIADLSRDAKDDPEFRAASGSYPEIRRYLETVGACYDAMDTLKEAWDEYADTYPSRNLQRDACPECLEDLNECVCECETCGEEMCDCECSI